MVPSSEKSERSPLLQHPHQTPDKNLKPTSLLDRIIRAIFPKPVSQDDKVYFIGAVAIPEDSWRGEGGKELWAGRYQFERMTVWERDDSGNAVNELHFYATTLEGYYKEWAAKIDNNELTGNSLRFDGFMEEKIKDMKKNNPEMFKDLMKETVRFLDHEDLNRTKASFENGSIQQIGLDSFTDKQKALLKPMREEWDKGIKNGTLPSRQSFNDYVEQQKKANPALAKELQQTQKPLKEENYAFVMGREKNDSREPALFLAIKGSSPEGKIQHSSFLKGGKVASAGLIQINDKGKIESVTQYSGHYLPCHDEMRTILTFLGKKLKTEDFEKINLNINKYTGLMLKATMAINTVFKTHFNYDPELGMVTVPAHKWLENLEKK